MPKTTRRRGELKNRLGRNYAKQRGTTNRTIFSQKRKGVEADLRGKSRGTKKKKTGRRGIKAVSGKKTILRGE